LVIDNKKIEDTSPSMADEQNVVILESEYPMDNTVDHLPQKNTVTGMQRVLEASIVTSTLLSLYLLLALYSFNVEDAAWTQTATGDVAKNWMGHAGAYLADILFVSVGVLAYSLPFLLAGLGYFLFKAHHKLRNVDFFTMGLRFIGFFSTAFGLLATASMNFDDIHQAFSAGGIVGDIISAAMLPNFNFIGTTLLLVCFIATGLTLMTGIGWMNVIEKTGELMLSLFAWCFNKVRKLSDSNNSDSNNNDIDDLSDNTDIKELAEDDTSNDSLIIEQPLFTIEHQTVNAAVNSEPSIVIDNSIIELDEHENMPSFNAKTDEDIDLTSYKRPIDNDELNADDKDNVSPSTAELADAIAAVQPKVVEVEMGKGTIAGLPAVKRSTTPLPALELLDLPKKLINPIAQEDLDRVSRLVEAKLLDFNVIATVVDVFPGPVITRFELDLAPGIKVSKISGLSKDLARSLTALSVRVVEVIPGKSVIGIEIPNENREVVYLRENLASDKFSQSKSALTMVLGKDISGLPVVVDLGKMPHLLVAGTTGSGKSVGVNAMIVSLLYKSTPDEVRMIMIDPKMLELSVYEGIPHLLSEVVTDMKEASNALRWCVGEMERRYKLLSAVGVRNLAGYNAKIKAAIEAGEPMVDPLWKAGDSMDETAPLLETQQHNARQLMLLLA